MFRGLLSAASIGLAIVITTFAVGTTTAAAVGGVSEDAFSSPRGMVLRGTHGYAIIVNTHPRSRGRRPEVVVSADDKRSLVRYAAPANLAGEGIHANLGRFGRINLRWVPDGRVEYEAYDREVVGRVEIERTIWTSGRPRTLSSSSDFAAATVEPPAPFEGIAYFARTSGALGSWLGDLTVDFPDVSDVPMAGVRFATTFYSGSFEGGAR
jgi:hypothetical protein